ncbi:hypothetical protein JA1_001973 [Spathaspora sp. JA1]|nr:hypothetical protein JA1_001973 [Spathaspora sp. JA1]
MTQQDTQPTQDVNSHSEEAIEDEQEEDGSINSQELDPPLRRYSVNSIESSEDDYIASDEDLTLALSHSFELPPNLPFTGSLTDHTNYFVSTLNTALDSIELDKSLVLQAQISGHLNNENQKLLEKRKVLIEKLHNLQSLYNDHFQASDKKPSKIDQMKSDIGNLQQRIEKLKYGSKTIFKSKEGVVKKYPIEYNQARDKVVERLVDDEVNEVDQDEDDIIF